MIGKVPDQGKSFRGVVNYLLFGKKQEPRPERVAWVETRNLLVDEPKKAATLMRLTAQKSKRVRKPVYHYVISWRVDESPSDQDMRLVADTTCDDLGLADYQRLYVAHRDTDHHHVHIVVNRVPPETGTAWKNSHDYRRIECSLRRQAEGMGLAYVPGRHNDPERFYGRGRRANHREQQRGRRLGTPPLPRWDAATREAHRDQLQEEFAAAGGWDDLERRLDGYGVMLMRKGQGLVIGNETGTMKRSDLGRGIRFKGLEERFGLLSTYEATHRDRTPARAAASDNAGQQSIPPHITYYHYRLGQATRRQFERSLAGAATTTSASDETSEGRYILREPDNGLAHEQARRGRQRQRGRSR